MDERHPIKIALHKRKEKKERERERERERNNKRENKVLSLYYGALS